MQTTTKKDIFLKIQKYVSQHGFGPKTPKLAKGLSADTFLQHYYDKKTLVEFCRQHNIPTDGLKKDLNTRIESFLRTGKIVVVKQTSKTISFPLDSELGLSLDRQVVNYKSNTQTRYFFAKHILGFGFNAYVQKWLKEKLANGDIFTYKDIIVEHKRYLQNRIQTDLRGKVPQVAHDSCQYNQFCIDYKHDASKKPHTMSNAWVLVRDSAGAKTYKRYKQEIEKIKNILK